MNRRPGVIGCPAPVWRPATQLSPANQRAMLFTSPNAVQVQWHRAFPNPAFNTEDASLPAGDFQYLRELQTPPPSGFWVLAGGFEQLQKYYPQGEWAMGDILVSYDEELTALSQFDWLIPLGHGTAPSGAVDYRTYTQKDFLVRAQATVAGTGTISASGTTVTGVGTAFTSFFKPGDVLVATRESFLIQSITDDTHLVLASSPPAWSGNSYQKGVDRLLYPPVAAISEIRDTSKTYVNGTDYVLSSDQETIQWLSASNSPVPGATYSVLYSYAAKYEITDLGKKRPVVGGRQSLSMVAAKLWKPQNLAR